MCSSVPLHKQKKQTKKTKKRKTKTHLFVAEPLLLLLFQSGRTVCVPKPSNSPLLWHDSAISYCIFKTVSINIMNSMLYHILGGNRASPLSTERRRRSEDVNTRDRFVKREAFK
ncbi:hypothetical protein NL108_017714 [Boleophthalmus pectinirostris]|nr:hypothetical protein NL108_017714 [Boleophthalmus pectinirostris]